MDASQTAEQSVCSCWWILTEQNPALLCQINSYKYTGNKKSSLDFFVLFKSGNLWSQPEVTQREKPSRPQPDTAVSETSAFQLLPTTPPAPNLHLPRPPPSAISLRPNEGVCWESSGEWSMDLTCGTVGQFHRTRGFVCADISAVMDCCCFCRV